MNLINFLLGPFLTYLPTIVWGGVLAIASITYFFSRFSLKRVVKRLAIAAVAFRVFYALILTIGQYYVWSGSKFTQLLLNSPLSDKVPLPVGLDKLPFLFQNQLGYFLFYSYGRFWLNVLISIIVAIGFYFFLKSLRQYNKRFFIDGEVELGFLTALVAGWPHFVLFLPFCFAAIVIISVFRILFMKEKYTTLGVPLILAAVVTLIFGDTLIKALGLTVLKI